MSTYEILKQAIREKRPIRAIYGGHERILCVHALGWKNGRRQAIAYQTGGSSSSGPVLPGSRDNWRCLRVDGLSNVELVEGRWESVSPHTRPNTCIDEIELEVSH